jgi:hypothetical protein
MEESITLSNKFNLHCHCQKDFVLFFIYLHSEKSHLTWAQKHLKKKNGKKKETESDPVYIYIAYLPAQVISIFDLFFTVWVVLEWEKLIAEKNQ